jgi:hypothetical protein
MVTNKHDLIAKLKYIIELKGSTKITVRVLLTFTGRRATYWTFSMGIYH